MAPARRVRMAVFVEEQGIPEHLELDSHDAECVHALAFATDGQAIGTARLMPDGRIGRLAVLRERRGEGVGSALLQALLEQAVQRGQGSVYLHALAQAAGFYARHGFRIQGSEYLEAGLPHVTMALEFGDAPAGHTG